MSEMIFMWNIYAEARIGSREGGKVSPALFKNRKKCPDFGEKGKISWLCPSMS